MSSIGKPWIQRNSETLLLEQRRLCVCVLLTRGGHVYRAP